MKITHFLLLLAMTVFVGGCEKAEQRSRHGKEINTLISQIPDDDGSASLALESALSKAKADLGTSRQVGEWHYGAGYALNEKAFAEGDVAGHEMARGFFEVADACINDDRGSVNQGTITTAIASTYHRVGLALYPGPGFRKNFDKALEVYAKAIPSLRSGRDFQNLSIALYSKGSVFVSYGDFDKAVKYVGEAVEIDKEHSLPDLQEDQEFLDQIKRLQSEQGAAGNPLPAE